MVKKSYLFVCSTQYAILNSINIVLSDKKKYNGKTDIVIFHQTRDIKNLSKIIKKNKIFENIYDFPFINKKNAFYLFLLLAFPSVFLSRLCLNKRSLDSLKNKYKIIIAQSQLYAALFKTINKNAVAYLLEDGVSSYTSRTSDINRRSFFFRLANKTFLRRMLIADIKGHLLYKPEMYCGEKAFIEKLPEHKVQNRNIYNLIFKYLDNDLYNSHQFIYLGAPYYGLKLLMSNPSDADSGIEERCKLLVDDAMKALKKRSFVYRIHPIEKIEKSYYEEFCILDNCKNMWEMECQNSITNDHVLLSFFSTAAFSPKIIYDKEPYVIFLHKITGFNFFNADSLIYRLQSMYTDPQKVMQPENAKELSTILKDLELKNKIR